eukprot:TRINITY_DN28102_c0_g1_i1.p1 TRINITY_DN28102_c0_g1~~TRINITY_DN28102_c0_g1_i1.p1  ORF type:complete len:547 (+),score=98.79 TRINITY_DN28102_c0_g1_i1:193-1833(+)
MLNIILIAVAAFIILLAIAATVGVWVYYNKVKAQHAQAQETVQQMNDRLTAPPTGACHDPQRARIDRLSKELRDRLGVLLAQHKKIGERQDEIRNDFQARYHQHVTVNGEDPETLGWDAEDIAMYNVNKGLKKEIRRRGWKEADMKQERCEADIKQMLGTDTQGGENPFNFRHNLFDELLEQRVAARRLHGGASADEGPRYQHNIGKPEFAPGSPEFDALVDEEYCVDAHEKQLAEKEEWAVQRAELLGEAGMKELFLRMDKRAAARLVRSDLVVPGETLRDLHPDTAADMTEEDVDRVFAAMDANSDGTVDFAEFLAYAKATCPTLFGKGAGGEGAKTVPAPPDSPVTSKPNSPPPPAQATPHGTPSAEAASPEGLASPGGKDEYYGDVPPLTASQETPAAATPAAATSSGAQAGQALMPATPVPPRDPASPVGPSGGATPSGLISMREAEPLTFADGDTAPSLGDDPDSRLRALAGGAPLMQSVRQGKQPAPRDLPPQGSTLSRPRRSSNSRREFRPPPAAPDGVIPPAMAQCEPVSKYVSTGM